MELDNQETDVIDESCFSYLCPLCVVEAPSMVFQLRGLCPETVFSTTYTFYLTDQGQVTSSPSQLAHVLPVHLLLQRKIGILFLIEISSPRFATSATRPR